MIAKQNLLYTLVGNTHPEGRYDPQSGIMVYSFREADIEDMGYKDFTQFIEYLNSNVLSKTNSEIRVVFEYAWTEDRDSLICEIVFDPKSDCWRYTTYYRQQRNFREFKILSKLIDYLKVIKDDHRLLTII